MSRGGNLKAEGFGDGGGQAIPKLRLRLPPCFHASIIQLLYFLYFSSSDQFLQVEDGQKHADHDGTDNDRHKKQQRRLDQCHDHF